MSNPHANHQGEPGDTGLERVRHLKSGGIYEVLGEAAAAVSESTTDDRGTLPNSTVLIEGHCLVVYRCVETDRLFCRRNTEFRDGWFETIASAPTPPDRVGEEVGREDLRHEATFLLARLRDFESELTDEQARDWYGHVTPSMERLHALASAPFPDPAGAGGDLTGEPSAGSGSREPGFDPSRGFAELKAKQATLGLGLVDITIIRHDGKAGVLFSPRGEHVEFGDEGRIAAGEHWPGPDDIVLWVEGKGPSVAISHLAQLGPEGPPAMSEGEALEVIGQLPAVLTADEHASAFRSAATRCASTAPARSRRLDARADKIEAALRTLQAAGEVR